MYMPYMTEIPSTQNVISEFRGYNNALQIGLGEWHRTRNLTNDYYPAFSPRALRHSVSKPDGVEIYAMTTYDGDLIWLSNLDGNGAVSTDVYLRRIRDGQRYEERRIDVEQGEKQIALMGTYMVIFPDGVYVSLLDAEDCGNINYSFSTNAYFEDIGFTVSPCDKDGNELLVAGPFKNFEEADAATGTLYVIYDSSLSGDDWVAPKIYRCTNAEEKDFEEINYYLRIQMNGFPTNRLDAVKEGDSISIDIELARSYPSYNRTLMFLGENSDVQGSFVKTVIKVVYGGIMIDGFISGRRAYYGYHETNDGVNSDAPNDIWDNVKIYKEVPKMDYIIECGNRLWGCRYSEEDKINEIYASQLGNFRNWNAMLGISTDSASISCGSPGEFTGAINYNGYPLFFKRDRVHKVYISSTGMHQVVELTIRGVQKGSGKSLAMIDGMLFYKSDSDVCVFDGTTATKISDALGYERYHGAVAASDGYRYYISMKDASDTPHLFCYDTRLSLWQHEGNTGLLHAVSGLNQVFLESGDQIVTTGTDPYFTEQEPALEWYAESGDIGYSDISNKYIGRFTVRCALQFQSELHISIQYDSDGYWEDKFCVTGTDPRTKSFSIPIIPRRCDHFAIRLSGKGDVKIYSIAFVYEGGSDT